MNLSEVSDAALRRRFTNDEVMDAIAEMAAKLNNIQDELTAIRTELVKLRERSPR